MRIRSDALRGDDVPALCPVCVPCCTLSSPAGWCVHVRDGPVSTRVSGVPLLYPRLCHSLPRPQLPECRATLNSSSVAEGGSYGRCAASGTGSDSAHAPRPPRCSRAPSLQLAEWGSMVGRGRGAWACAPAEAHVGSVPFRLFRIKLLRTSMGIWIHCFLRYWIWKEKCELQKRPEIPQRPQKGSLPR